MGTRPAGDEIDVADGIITGDGPIGINGSLYDTDSLDLTIDIKTPPATAVGPPCPEITIG